MYTSKSIDNNGIITNIEIGNWSIDPHRDGYAGFIMNYDTDIEATYTIHEVENELIIAIYNMKGTQSPIPNIPKHIQTRIISMERQNFKKLQKLAK